MEQHNRCIPCGCRNLGPTILGYSGFREYGLNIIAAFDDDGKESGHRDSRQDCLPHRQVADMVKRMGEKDRDTYCPCPLCPGGCGYHGKGRDKGDMEFYPCQD